MSITKPQTGQTITTEWGQWIHDSIAGKYDVSTTELRNTFIGLAEIGKSYLLKDGNNIYHVEADVKVDGISVSLRGQRGWTAGDGNKKTDFIILNVTTGGATPIQATIYAGEYMMHSAKVPGDVKPTELTSKATTEQMIIDNNNSLVSSETDPSWQDLTGTQTTQFNPNQLTVTLTGSQIQDGKFFQYILGSTAAPLVLDSGVRTYDNPADAARNGYVAGQYKWYVYKSGDNEYKFVMEDSKGTLTDNGQTIAKIRSVTPNAGQFKGHYTSQVDVLKKSIWIGDLAKGSSLTVDLPTGVKIEDLSELGFSVSGTTDWTDVRNWDIVTKQYCSVMTEDTSNTWWIEYAVESIPGDNTKIKITNMDSGNQNGSGQAYRAHWFHYKVGR